MARPAHRIVANRMKLVPTLISPWGLHQPWAGLKGSANERFADLSELLPWVSFPHPTIPAPRVHRRWTLGRPG
jgi:hypothetical protein